MLRKSYSRVGISSIIVFLFGCTPRPPAESAGQPPSSQYPGQPITTNEDPVSTIRKLANSAQCRSPNPERGWNDRGRAPKAYLEGMALVFARSVCQRQRTDVELVSSAAGSVGRSPERTDGLVAYRAEFAALGRTNERSGADTLRNTYTLLIGLGMRESSGQYCVGRDRSANFTSADSAEAGLFQTSWGVNRANPELASLFQRYRTDQSGCLLNVFSQGVACGAHDAETWGEGTGAEWQKLSKTCPAFATEYAAVVLRTSGGTNGEFGPIRNRAAQLVPACESMLKQVQTYVINTPSACAALN